MTKHIKSRIAEPTVQNSKQKLKNIPCGETFMYAGYEWIVLEHDSANHTRVLTKNTIRNMPFDENNSNNWAKSTLRKYLNGEFLKEMCIGLPPENLGFTLFKTDLTADDGLKDYGESIDMVSLMTCDLYRKHRDILEPIDEWWWLATPYSTLAAGSCSVRCVYADGTLYRGSAYYGDGGVRPVCYLSSEVMVERSQNNDES